MKCQGLHKNQHNQIQSKEAGQEKKFQNSIRQERYPNQCKNEAETIEWVTIGVESFCNAPNFPHHIRLAIQRVNSITCRVFMKKPQNLKKS